MPVARQPARQEVVEDHADGVEVSPRIDVSLQDLLGSGVGERADEGTGGWPRGDGDKLGSVDLGEAEVEDAEELAAAAGRDEAVARLEVPMEHAGGMEGRDGGEDLADEADAALPGNLAVRDQLGEVSALEQRHEEEAEGFAVGAALLAEVQHRRQVGVVEGPCDPRFVSDPPTLRLGSGVLGMDHLDGQPSAHVGVSRGIHARGAASTDEHIEMKAAGKRPIS